jgi:hypothetical protein
VLGTHYALSEYLGRTGRWQRLRGDTEPSAAYLWLAQATDVFIVVTLLLATTVIAALGWGLRYLGVHREMVRTTAALTRWRSA